METTQISLSQYLFTILFLLLALLSSGLQCCRGLEDHSAGSTQTTKLYIAYMGEKQHEDPDLVTELHHGVLSSALGSKEAAQRSIVHSYRHGFSGFAAMLTDSQAKRVAELPGVLGVRLSSTLQLQTTRSWDFLGLGRHLQSSPPSTSELLRKANGGDGIIIGVIDTGIWPEADSFNDRGYGPIPSRWKGTCQTGEQFNASHCNRKIIGARWYTAGVADSYLTGEYLSARDQLGHGTHVASIAAGSYVGNASYQGLGRGRARGGAPRARLAVYKVLWGSGIANVTGSEAGLLKAFDHAAHDGVDVVCLSLALRESSWGSLDAVLRGITVVYAAGNGGPLPQSVVNAAPWVITVAASTIDRSFPTDITLADNRTFVGQAIYYRTTDDDDGFKELAVATRNDTLFKSEKNHQLVKVDTLLSKAIIYLRANGDKFKEYTANDYHQQNWCTKRGLPAKIRTTNRTTQHAVWQTPVHGWLKGNFDGSFKMENNRNTGGCGVIIRNARGECKYAGAVHMNYGSILKTEAMAALLCLKEMEKFSTPNLAGFWLEGDSMIIIQNLSKSNTKCPPEIAGIISQAQEVTTQLCNLKISHSPRETNKAANWLAIQARIAGFSSSWSTSIPQDLAVICDQEASQNKHWKPP